MGGRDSLRERPEGIRIDRLKAFRQGIREPVELVGVRLSIDVEMDTGATAET